MKLISLTQNQFTKVDDEDFDYLNQWKWYALWSPNTNSFYAVRAEYSTGKKLRIHRIIMNVTDPKLQVDHVFHDTLDNRKCNLRVVTKRQNLQNRKGGSSIYPGVTFMKNQDKWISRIVINKKIKYLGLFINEIDAYILYTKLIIIKFLHLIYYILLHMLCKHRSH